MYSREVGAERFAVVELDVGVSTLDVRIGCSARSSPAAAGGAHQRSRPTRQSPRQHPVTARAVTGELVSARIKQRSPGWRSRGRRYRANPIIGRSSGRPRARVDTAPSCRGERRLDRYTPGRRRRNVDGTGREYPLRRLAGSNRSRQTRSPRPPSMRASFRLLRASSWDAGSIGRRRCGDRGE
jgi:hypothetical protein